MNVSSTSPAAVQSTQQPTRLQKAEQAQVQSQRQQVVEAAAPPPPPPPPPKPTVNTQGQTTGRLVNVTA